MGNDIDKLIKILAKLAEEKQMFSLDMEMYHGMKIPRTWEDEAKEVAVCIALNFGDKMVSYLVNLLEGENEKGAVGEA